MRFLFFILAFSFLQFSANLAEAEEIYSDTTSYTIDTDSSKVEWACDLHHGYLLLEEGKLLLVDGEIVNGDFRICMESIIDLDIDYELMRKTLENTLKSIEFFNTEKYHYSSFNIDFVENKNNLIYGDLTFLGVTKCISFNYNTTLQNDSILVTTEEIIIDRTDWGSTSMSKDDAKSDKSFIVPNDVKIKVILVGIKSRLN